MKRSIPFILLFVLVRYAAFTQDCKTFDCTMQQAKTAFENKDYRAAYTGFQSAKSFRKSNLAEADAWIGKVVDALENEKKQALTLIEKPEPGIPGIEDLLDRRPFYKGQYGLAFDKVNEKYGFTDPKGNIKIRFKYQYATPFDEQGFAQVSNPVYKGRTQHFLIDTLGHEYRMTNDLTLLDSSITALDLRDKNLSIIPEKVCQNKQLQVLLLGQNNLSSLPDNICTLINLKILYANDNQIANLPDGFGQLRQLEVLHLGQNQISSLPASFGQLPRLESFIAQANQLTQLPETFGRLSYLKNLCLDFNKIVQLPEGFGQLARLESFELMHNQLTVLPSDFGRLHQLKVLYLFDNHLTSLPASIGQLSHLTTLYVNKNQLSSLPAEIGQLTATGRFDFV
jgi:hypothetical protein